MLSMAPSLAARHAVRGSRAQRISSPAQRPVRAAVARSAKPVAQMSTEDASKAVVASAMASTLTFADSAAAAQELSQIAADGRILAAVGKKRAVVAGLTGLSVATMAAAPSADAAQARSAAPRTEVAQVAFDGRFGILLALATPVVAWVLFNIGVPAFRQVMQMAEKPEEKPGKKALKKRAAFAGLTGLAAAAMCTPAADAAQEIAQVAIDSRPLVLLGLATVVISWVLFNIFGPASRQVGDMVDKAVAPPPKKGSKKRAVVAGLTGLAAAAMSTPAADAAQEIAQVAIDSRPLVLLGLATVVISWVLFNIFGPASRQVGDMVDKAVAPPPTKKGKKGPFGR